jgi:hypothetical protein
MWVFFNLPMSKINQCTHKLTYHNGPLGLYLVYECIGPFNTFIKFRNKSLIAIIITIQKCIRCLHCFYFFLYSDHVVTLTNNFMAL